MAQSAFISQPDPSMALNLREIDDQSLELNLRSTTLGVRCDGQPLLAPSYNGRRMDINLTPGEDDWLQILDVDGDLSEHHQGDPAQALHLAVQVNQEDAAKLERIDQLMQKQVNYAIIRPGSKPWFGMHHGDGRVVLALLLEDSVAPTTMKFVQGDVLKAGTGKAFLDECLNGASLKDFCCKALVQLECLQCTSDEYSIVLVVHEVIFAPFPKRTIVRYTAAEDAAAMRAAKRLKYRF